MDTFVNVSARGDARDGGLSCWQGKSHSFIRETFVDGSLYARSASALAILLSPGIQKPSLLAGSQTCQVSSAP
jgi:hypothetical protein